MVKRNKILFVHQNFPGQYKHISKELIDIGYEVHTLSITKFIDKSMTNHHYQLAGNSTKNINKWAIEFESKMIRAGSAANKAMEMKKNGFFPDLIIGHPGWGETFFFKEVWPEAKLLTYAEFYYKTKNSDIDFDPKLIQDDLGIDFESFYSYTKFKLTARNSPFLSTYAVSDYLMSPTNYQKSLLPASLRDNVEVIHDGIDTDILKPDENVTLKIRDKQFSKSDQIITYVSRSLDPYRGFHTFVKSIPQTLKDNPEANIIIVGNADTPGYGASPPDGKLYKEI